MNNYELIRKAILSKQQITAVYRGYHREMCPHVLGMKGGRKQALFYQFGGDSESGTLKPGSWQNWRCIPVDDLRDILLKNGPWYTAPNYYLHPQSCVDKIDIKVKGS